MPHFQIATFSNCHHVSFWFARAERGGRGGRVVAIGHAEEAIDDLARPPPPAPPVYLARPLSDRTPPDTYRPISRRRRLLIVVLAVATAVTVVATLLDPPGGVQRQRAAAASAAATPADCGPGQQIGCVGGKAEVLAPQPTTGR